MLCGKIVNYAIGVKCMCLWRHNEIHYDDYNIRHAQNFIYFSVRKPKTNSLWLINDSFLNKFINPFFPFPLQSVACVCVRLWSNAISISMISYRGNQLRDFVCLKIHIAIFGCKTSHFPIKINLLFFACFLQHICAIWKHFFWCRGIFFCVFAQCFSSKSFSGKTQTNQFKFC